MIYVILNGKKAGLDEVREAIYKIRSEGIDLQVRVTWEKGDGARFVREAVDAGAGRIIAAGGDGTINELVQEMAGVNKERRPALGIMPLGTANDFAVACAIPPDPENAIRLAVSGDSVPVDLVRANDRYFINVATGGFVTEVTAAVPVQVKNFLGGTSYTLAALTKALDFEPRHGSLLAEGVEIEGEAITGAVCNGRQAGGGKVLAPRALINDGLLDVVIILTFPIAAVSHVIQELFDPTLDGRYVRRFQSGWVESFPSVTRSVNLDGEPFEADHIRFEVLPGEVQLVLPPECPCLADSGPQPFSQQTLSP